MIKDHIVMDYTAMLMCDRCHDTLDAVGGSESEAEQIVIQDAGAEGWMELDGTIICGECNR